MKTYFLDVILNHYADFKGRATRKQFWLFQLWGAITFVLLLGCLVLAGIWESQPLAWGSVIGMLLLFVGTLIPNIAIHVRRLHDIDFSGWWLLLNLISLGQFVILIFCCLPSVDEGNRF